MDDFSLKIIPLGGCGEIGMNMTILCVMDRYFFVDGGALFPDASLLGVDLILPDTKFIDENQIWPEAWLITHGHEDHIGALPHLYKKYPAPIYGTEFTLELIKSKFEDAEINDAILNKWDFFETVFFRNLKVTPFPVNHSIADAAGLFFETQLGNILHMGDFRIDYYPPEKSMTHENIKKVLNNKTVHLMMSDSTNSFQTGTDFSETEILPSIIDFFDKEKGIVVIATFASNIWRLQSIFESARLTGRKVALFGRSLFRNTEIANRLGLLNFSENTIIEIQDVHKYPRHEVCIICTGSQGESFSGLHRIAWDNVSDFKIDPEDTIIFSSRIIPGNERPIESIVTQLTRSGCQVVTAKDHKNIHVSGHGYQEDLIKCIKTAQPISFMPVHGTYRHLKKHRELAIDCGLLPENCFLAENGDVVVAGPEALGVVETVHSGRDYVCPGGIFPQSSPFYKDRLALIYGGVVAVSFVFPDEGYELLGTPSVSLKGIPLNAQELSKKMSMIFNYTYDLAVKKRNFNDEVMQEDLRIAVRRYIEKKLNFKTNVLILFQRI
ncbi:ribonuclease J [Fluviispira multicolorata]|uniref:RNase J family beta-CASP ribonuclease n=1 Tax=Fluviispira multicolorata TaxID=2654512 RepID=A0A833N4Q0_9BACT|nr:ribonuclease J [Fluviispira multicolorata]KAB8031041.1 RNase J family beta-CASP ribonuclease [Fluviispira multicolorata]